MVELLLRHFEEIHIVFDRLESHLVPVSQRLECFVELAQLQGNAFAGDEVRISLFDEFQVIDPFLLVDCKVSLGHVLVFEALALLGQCLRLLVEVDLEHRVFLQV